MEKKQALLIINPISGTRSKEGLDTLVASRLSEAGYDVAVETTRYGGHARELAAEAAARGVSLVLSAGGDGTVNEIATAISHTQTTLGILPFGSGNGLARSLGIPLDVEAALKVVTDGYNVTCDRGLVNGRPFYCAFGMGFDAAVSRKFAMQKRRGPAMYLRSIIQEFMRYRSQPYGIAVDGNIITQRAFLVAVCNAPQYGNNAYIAPQARLDDGLLDLIVIHDGSPITTMFMGVDLMTGMIDRNTRISSFKVKKAAISRLDDGPVHLDGEPLQMGKEVNVACDAAALRVFAPKNDEHFTPIVSPLKAMISDIRYDVKALINSASPKVKRLKG